MTAKLANCITKSNQTILDGGKVICNGDVWLSDIQNSQVFFDHICSCRDLGLQPFDLQSNQLIFNININITFLRRFDFSFKFLAFWLQ